MRQPNLLIFLPDQQRTDTIGCYGGAKVHAPSLNKLASESVIFERAYVTHPVCVPSRASLFTGLWPHQNGCTRNGVALDRRFPVLTELLQNKQHYCCYMGKWQLGDAPTERGFDDWVTTEKVSDYSQLLNAHGIPSDRPNGTYSRLLVSTLPFELSKPKFLQDRACQFIKEHRDAPFILVVAYVEPHTPYNSPFNDEHSLDEIDLDPTALTPPGADIPLRYRLIRERQHAHAIIDRKRLPDLYYVGITPEEYRRLKQRYFGLVTMVDRSIGAILGCLESAGLTDKTIIVHTSDHGDSMGAHQLFGKETMFEESARVPYLVRMPGQRRSIKVTQAISHIDFLPSLLELLGQAHPAHCQGKSRVPLLRGETMAPENVFLQWAPNRMKAVKWSSIASRRQIKRALDESTRSIVTTDLWKLCLRDKDSNELYNLNVDPIEAHNLYHSGKYEEIIARGRDEIHRWQQSVDDTVNI